jgi:hypothetical protein
MHVVTYCGVQSQNIKDVAPLSVVVDQMKTNDEENID